MEDRRGIGALGEALRRVVAMIVAMAGYGEETALLRRQRNTILRLLRPAESAVRRLIMVMAQGLAVDLPPQRPRRKPEPCRTARKCGFALVLSLLDPQRSRARKRWVRPSSVPRILALHEDLHALPPIPRLLPPMPEDVLDAARLNARVAALSRAMGDLEGRARAFARWQARQALALRDLKSSLATGQARARLVQRALRRPLRIGRAPGTDRRSPHEVHALLNRTDFLARDALAPP